MENRALSREWFYPFELPSGRTTPVYPGSADIMRIHDTRLKMMDRLLDDRYGESLAGRTALDVACHEGYFSHFLARRGAGVVAIDARREHVADASLMRDIQGLDKLRILQMDECRIDVETLGQFDIVLHFGLIYHLEDPVGALRRARAVTRDVCLVETQVIPGMTGVVDYGSYRYVKPLMGSFGIIDETRETDGPEASTQGICLVPSLDGLLWILEKVGFRDVQVLPVPEAGCEQLRYGKRVRVAGYA